MLLLALLCALLAQSDRSKPAWIWTEAPTRPWYSAGFGSSVGALGDADADGVRDFLIADVIPPLWAPTQRSFEGHGRAWILSGRDGRVLHEVVGPFGADQASVACADLGDVDGDGRDDCVVGWDEGLEHRGGYVEIRSGGSGERILFLRGPSGHASFVANAGDLDGDGRADFVTAGERDVLAMIRSSSDGRVLRRFEGQRSARQAIASPVIVDTGRGIEIAVLSKDHPGACTQLSMFDRDSGRYVTFTSNAVNLVTTDTNGGTVDVFLRDLQLSTTTIVSLDSFGNQGNLASGNHSISFDGRFVAFASSATNLVPNDTNNRMDIFVRDRTLGFTSRASLSSTGAQSDADSFDPSLSQDGRYVAFESNASNLAPSTPFQRCIYVRDRATGLTTLESVNTSGNTPNGLSQNVTIASNGRFLVFESPATDLVLGDTNGSVDVFERDRGALPAYDSYCFGDGFGGSCPCANESDYGLQEGCKHALGYGAKLTAEGLADTANDTFVLVGSQLTNSAALYFQGTADVNGGNGMPFGDGLLCIGGTITRLGVEFAVLGTSRYPSGIEPAISVAGAVTFGTFRHYQAWYRDAIPFCTIATFNLTNALQVLWLPCPMCP